MPFARCPLRSKEERRAQDRYPRSGNSQPPSTRAGLTPRAQSHPMLLEGWPGQQSLSFFTEM
jgi:hypothetical protein